VLLVPPPQLQRIGGALRAAAAVGAQPLLERGFSGKALGAQLQRERLAAIGEIWS
jgi:hypothetical protein